MADSIVTLLTTPLGSFSSIAALLITAFWFVHWATKRITEIRSSNEHVKNSVGSLYERIDRRVDKIEGSIDDIRKDMAYLKVNIEIFQQSSVAQRKSPISLTEGGCELSEKLHAEEMIARNWGKIFENLEENIPEKSAYDIQQYIFETATVNLEEFLEKADVDAVKTFAYNDGRPLGYYAPVFAVPIRDKYLAQKGVDIAEVDKNNPNP